MCGFNSKKVSGGKKMVNSISHGTILNQKEILDDLLMSEKHITYTYSSGITESTCPNLRFSLNKCLTSAQQCQFELFKVMEQRGWYEVEEASHELIESVKNKYIKILNEFN